MLRSLALTCALALSLASPALSQVDIALSPMGGAFFPVGSVPVPRLIGDVVSDESQKAGFLVGGRVTVRTLKLGVEVEGAYAWSSVDLPDALVGQGFPDDSRVAMLSLNLTYDLFKAPLSPLAIFLTGGGGIVNRSGDFFDLFEKTTDPTGAVGIGLRFGLGPIARLRFDIRDYISSYQPTGPGNRQFDSKIQNDVIATIGLEFGLSPMP